MSTIEATRCDECGRVFPWGAALVRLDALDLDFCITEHLQRYIAKAPKGEREAVEEQLIAQALSQWAGQRSETDAR
jgi:hypothetical protein